jgi:hypothetical protein
MRQSLVCCLEGRLPMRSLSCYLISAAVLAVTLGGRAAAAQVAVADPATDLTVARPAYPREMGPIVGVDAAHNNYHTIDGRYGPFASVLRNDGYRVVSVRTRVDRGALRGLSVLVVANPLAASNIKNWNPPNPSAFDDAEIEAIRKWVSDGGALFLIADHMPFAGAVTKLAGAFGFRFDDDFAGKGDGRQPEIFSRAAGTLADNEITRGSGREAAVDQVETFSGSSFRGPPGTIPIMVLDDSWTLLWPEKFMKFDAATRMRKATRDDLRGAALAYGKGRVAVVSEAALFTNQLVNGAPYGFGRPSAAQDKQLLVNIVEWLGRAPSARAKARPLIRPASQATFSRKGRRNQRAASRVVSAK